MHLNQLFPMIALVVIAVGLIFGLFLPYLLSSLSTQKISYKTDTSNSISYSNDTSNSWHFGDSGSSDDGSSNDSSSCDSGGSDGGGCDSSGD